MRTATGWSPGEAAVARAHARPIRSNVSCSLSALVNHPPPELSSGRQFFRCHFDHNRIAKQHGRVRLGPARRTATSADRTVATRPTCPRRSDAPNRRALEYTGRHRGAQVPAREFFSPGLGPCSATAPVSRAPMAIISARAQVASEPPHSRGRSDGQPTRSGQRLRRTGDGRSPCRRRISGVLVGALAGGAKPAR